METVKFLPCVEVLFILISSIITRFYKLCQPDVVCWDETHFGKFASFYLKSENYFDVHPPLGKMMLAMFGYMSGYNGSFSFEEPGQKYEETRYCGIRGYCAILGALIPPLAYFAVSLQISRRAGLLCAILLICDTGLITLTQFILLESPLFFFLITTLLLYQITRSIQRYSRLWFCAVTLTGISIGCIMSVKYIGVFTVLYTGFMVIEDIWKLHCDTKNSLVDVAKYVAVCVGCLIVIPIFLYLLFFVAHFHFTRNSSGADSAYSPGFQASLVNSKIVDTENSRYLRFGNTIRLRNGAMLLHSHHLQYPDINLNQVTGYSYRDENNQWIIERCADGPEDSHISSSDVVRLRHNATSRYLTTTTYSAVLAPRNYRVVTIEQADLNSCYQIQTDNNMKIRTFQHNIMLVSINNKCSLSMGDDTLPDYAGKQIEVSCQRRYFKKPDSTLFTLEQNISPYPSENTERVPVMGLLSKLVEMQTKMLVTNNALIPSETVASSRPWMWPVNYEGLWFAITVEHGGVYFLGNPIIFLFNLMAVLVLVYINIYNSYLVLRQKEAYEPALLHQSNWYLAGYLLHYIPFYMMGRVLYFHHFYSAFLFNTMLTAGVVELGFTKNSKVYNVVYGALICACVASFAAFSPLAYGIPVDENKQTFGYIKSLKWLDTWGF